MDEARLKMMDQYSVSNHFHYESWNITQIKMDFL
jgi:hypothetical protein